MILDKQSTEANGKGTLDGDHPASPTVGPSQHTDPPPPTVALVPGLSSREKARRLLAANRASDIGQRTLAFYLNEMHTSGDYKDFGCASARQFATDKLEIPRTTALELLEAGSELTRLTRTDRAFCEGELGWSKTYLLCKIAVPQTEEQWIATAHELTVRELQREVRATEKGRPPRGNRRGLPRLSYTIEGRTDEIGHEVWETARQKFAEDVGEAVSNSEMMQTLAEAYLRHGQSLLAPQLTLLRGDEAKDAAGLDGAAGKESRKRLGDSLFCLVVEKCPCCKETALHKEDGPVILSRAKAEMVEEDARIHVMPAAVETGEDAEEGDVVSLGLTGVGRPTGFNCSAADAASRGAASPAPGDIDIPTPSWMRRMVLLRDGNRCRCCRRRYLLMAHHVIFRSEGGETHPRNLVGLCATCHEMVHEGKLTLEGNADAGFRFLDGDGEPVGKPMRSPGATRVLVQELAGSGGAEGAGKGDVVSLGLTGVGRPTAASDCSAADAASRDATSWDGASRGTRCSFKSLPPFFDAAEWDRFAPCLVWNERRRMLEWREEGRWVDIESDNDSQVNTDLAPPCPEVFSSLLGLETLTTSLRIAAEAARLDDRAMPPVLLSGPPGVGKTAVARALAAAVGSRAHNIQGPMLRDPGVLAAWLTCARKHDVFFIDEIHAVPQGICELLYEVIDRRTLTLFVSRGTSTKTITIRLEPISIVGATTHLAEIPEAFRSRFTTRCAIDFYEIGNLEKIVERRAGEIGIGIDPVARHEVARASKGIPRQAIAILGHARDVTRVAGRTAIEAADVRQALRGHDIDAFGLEPTDRKVVEILQKARRPVSLGRLAAYVGLPIATLRDVVEPFLLRAGLVDVTARGRVAVG